MQRFNQLRLDKQLTKVKVGKAGLTPSTVAHIQELLRKHEFLRVSTRWRQGRSSVWQAGKDGVLRMQQGGGTGYQVSSPRPTSCRPALRSCCWA